MKDLLLYIVNALVQHPDKVQVEVTEKDGEALLRLSVAPEDMGKIIGRSGRTARDLRVLLRAAAGNAGTKVNLEIVEQA